MSSLSAQLRPRIWPKAIIQALCLSILSISLGLGFNYFRAKPLPLYADHSPLGQLNAQLGQDISLSLEEAKIWRLEKKALFLDAREEAEYAAGHILGAFNAPPLDLGGLRDKALAGLPKNAAIVCYCGGGACELAGDLAQDLAALGYSNVRVFTEGYPAWIAAGLPTEQGQ